MTKSIYQILLLTIILIFVGCKNYKDIPQPDYYKLSINKLSMNNITKIDTVWYSISPSDDNSSSVVLQIVNDGSANVTIIGKTNEYILVKRPVNFNNQNLKIRILAYGDEQDVVSAKYINARTKGGNSDEKILFNTGTKWVLWNITKNVEVASTNQSLYVADYKSEKGVIVVKGYNAITFYNEDFTPSLIPNITIQPSSNVSNICFIGDDLDISYNFSDHFAYYDYSQEYLEDYNTNGDDDIFVYYDGWYHFLVLKTDTREIQLSKSTYQNNSFSYAPIEISKNGKYVIYNYGSGLNLINLDNLNSIQINSNCPEKSCFDSSSSKICFVSKNDNKLYIYNIADGQTSNPLTSSVYSATNITEAYW